MQITKKIKSLLFVFRTFFHLIFSLIIFTFSKYQFKNHVKSYEYEILDINPFIVFGSQQELIWKITTLQWALCSSKKKFKCKRKNF